MTGAHGGPFSAISVKSNHVHIFSITIGARAGSHDHTCVVIAAGGKASRELIIGL